MDHQQSKRQDDLRVSSSYRKGRGSQINPPNPFHHQHYARVHEEGLDEHSESDQLTEYLVERPKRIVNEVASPDIGPALSANPYQGCEHGCVYCYARNSHTYWGFSAGLDFERKIIVKPDAADILEKQLRDPRWEPRTLMLSGNTDCYQPIERKLKTTRRMLEVLLRYRHPVGLITKNSLILRDLDLLEELALLHLVTVSVSLTTFDEKLRRSMEPRTASGKKRLEVIRTLSELGVPVNVMIAPVIPGLNSDEIPQIIKRSAEAGAISAAMMLVRLNGDVAEIFTDWIRQSFPDRAEKVLSQIRSTHGGKLSDSRFGIRMNGEGPIAAAIGALFKSAKKKYLGEGRMPLLNTESFRRTYGSQMNLFK